MELCLFASVSITSLLAKLLSRALTNSSQMAPYSGCFCAFVSLHAFWASMPLVLFFSWYIFCTSGKSFVGCLICVSLEVWLFSSEVLLFSLFVVWDLLSCVSVVSTFMLLLLLLLYRSPLLSSSRSKQNINNENKGTVLISTIFFWLGFACPVSEKPSTFQSPLFNGWNG